MSFVNGNRGAVGLPPCLGPEFFQFQIDCVASQVVFGRRDDYIPSDQVELGVYLALQYDRDLRSSLCV